MKEFPALQNDQVALDDDGWALIAPFGRWPKTRRYTEDGQVKEQHFIQVLDNEAADAMTAKENSFFGRIKRALIGVPVYKNHGDLKDIDPKAISNAEKIKIGVVDQIRKAPRGLEAHFALDNEGADAVAAGHKFPSAFWWVLPNGQKQGEAIEARPFKLISVALTPFPNIHGVESLANQQTDPVKTETINQNEIMLLDKITGLLIGKGVSLPNEAGESDIMAVLANGDYLGHEFHGNQHTSGEAHGKEHEASRKAHMASSAASDKAGHEKAAAAHAAAAKAHAKAGDDETAQMHEAAAKYHAARAAKFKK